MLRLASGEYSPPASVQRWTILLEGEPFGWIQRLMNQHFEIRSFFFNEGIGI